MKASVLAVITTLSTIAISVPIQAENLSDLNQLLGTKKCSQCDLSNAGLVMSNLIGADLKQANLISANLSQANLTGADLTGADLTGASLHGANLTDANLTGAKLTGTDLRNAYLGNTNLKDVDLNTAYLQGVRGISNDAATPEQFHRWGVGEAKKGNYDAAIAHYQRAIKIDSEFAPAYLGLAMIQFRFDNRTGAQQNAQIAADLFKKQEHKLGYQTAFNFRQQIELVQQAEENVANQERGASNIGKFMGGVGSLLLQLLF